ncbi:MAG TPA: substrate-binding domain-containing protein [Vicinamibacterales bacterium]|nr:substrate-binding domain-containing protein [Vicinamibacterales bacterium]
MSALALARAHLQLGRPSDSALALVGTFIGARLAGVPDIDLAMIVSVAISNGLLSAASMMLNDWHDVVEDRINRPERPIPSGLVPRPQALALSIVLFVTAIGLAALAGPWFGIGAAAVVTLSAAYTFWLKPVPWLGNTLVATLSAYPLWCWLPFATTTGSLYLTVVAGYILMGIGREIIRTGFDVPGDWAAGVRTVATTLGARAANRIGAVLILAALGAGWIPVVRGEARWLYGALLAISTAVAVSALLALVGTRDRRAEIPSSGRLIVVARTIIVIMLLGLVSGCGSPPKDVTPRPVIAVVPRGSTQLFWRTIRAGAQKAGAELGVEVVWPGAFKETDVQAQIDIVEQAHALGAKAIALAPLDPDLLAPKVAELKAAGVPVAIFDTELSGSDYIAEIGTDDHAAGRAAADQLAAQMKGQGRIALLRLSLTATSTMRREAGFLEAMQQFPGIQVVSDDVFTGPLLEDAYRGAHALIARTNARTGGLDAVFCSNESTTLGMLKALEDFDLANRVRLVGFDRSPRLVNALEHGQIHLLVVQDAVRIGYATVKTLVDHLAGRPVETRQWIQFAVADPNSFGVPFVRDLLYPHLALRQPH